MACPAPTSVGIPVEIFTAVPKLIFGIWVAKVPVPIASLETSIVDENFNQIPEGKELDKWNLYSPIWARTQIEKHTKKHL